MKRILSFLLIVAFVLSFAACKDPSSPHTPSTEQDRVRLIVLAGQSGARGKALVGDLSKDEREENEEATSRRRKSYSNFINLGDKERSKSNRRRFGNACVK